MQTAKTDIKQALKALMVALMLYLACGMAVAQTPETPDFDKKLVEWRKTIDDAEAGLSAGPVNPEAIPDIKELIKNVRTQVAADSKTATDNMASQNALLLTLGPAPAADSHIKEDKKVGQQRAELTAQISKLDAQLKQAALLTARADKITADLTKQTTTVRKTEILQKSLPLLTPEAMKTAVAEARAFLPGFRFTTLSGGFLVLTLLILLMFSRSITAMKEWATKREILKIRPRGNGFYLQMLICAAFLLADRVDIFGLTAAPAFAEVLRLWFSAWLAFLLFLFLSGIKFALPDGVDEEESGVPVGFLNFLLGLMKISALLLLPAAVLGYVQLAAYIALNMAGSLAAIMLFISARAGLIGLNLRLAKLFAVERLLSPLVIAFFEPVLAAVSFLFAATFWGVTPADVRDWADHLSGGITIGSIKLDFSDAGAAAVVFFALYAVTRALQIFLSKRLFPQTHMDRGVQDAVYTLIGYGGVTIALLTSLGTLGLDMAKLAIVAGALSVGIGFGLQAIVNNFVSGLILLFERPIRVGDFIKVGTEQGQVRRIRVRATELETPQSGSIIVPNSKLISESVTNWTLEGRSVRVEITVNVAHASDPVIVKRLLAEAAAEHPQVRKRPEPLVLLNNFNATGMEFEMRCYIRDIADRHIVSSDLRFSIDRLFRQSDITRT